MEVEINCMNTIGTWACGLNSEMVFGCKWSLGQVSLY